MDLKVIPRSYKGHKYTLCFIDEITNYVIMDLIHQSRSEEIGDSLIEYVIAKYCVPNYIIMDQDSAFMYSLIKLFVQETLYQNKNSGTLQSSIIASRTWN